MIKRRIREDGDRYHMNAETDGKVDDAFGITYYLTLPYITFFFFFLYE